jgi:hypothetical protein
MHNPVAPQAEKMLSIFGPRSVFENEDAAAYDELLLRLSSAIKPSDVLEEIWIRDVVDLEWDVLRFRKARKHQVSQAIANVLSDIMTDAGEFGTRANYLARNSLLQKWQAGNPAALEEIRKMLAKTNLTMEQIEQMAFISELDAIERLDRLTAAAEARRNAAIREIMLHRAAFGNRVRKELLQIDASARELGVQTQQQHN